ncbi:hypothetical protein N9A87_01325 [Euryarchaeota archaeon]|nr:hypothetical protein [Euryarchaeota archaeon]
MEHINHLLKAVREHDLMIPSNHQDMVENNSVNKPRSTDWMRNPNKRIPDSLMNKFENWGFAHEQQSGYRVEPRLPLLETFNIQKDVEQGYLFPSDYDLELEWLRDEVDEHGIEALAWYRPFHISPQNEWGITITDRGVWYLAKNVMSQKYDYPYTLEQIHDCFELAYEFLYYHELFHFKVEYAATILELNSPHKPVKVYAPFWEDGFYHPGPNNCSPLEEAMANEYARYKVCKGQPKKLRDAIERFMRTQQPSGYRDFGDVKHHKKWQQGLESLVETMIGRSTPFATSIFDQYKAYIDDEEAVPCRIVTTGLPDRYSVRLMNLAKFCRTKKFEKSILKVKSKDFEAYKDLERSFKEIEQDGFDSLKNRDGRMWKEWDQKKNKRVGEYRVDGTNYRVYLTENSDEWIFRLISPKSQQTANLKSLKRDKFSVYQAIHVFDCVHR